MLWFDGSIRNAIDRVKASGVVLLIFVEGKDALSKIYDEFLRTRAKLTFQECVALKITENSVGHRQFKQIYFSVPVPSLFFLRNDGIPVKVVSSENTADLLRAITDVFSENKNAEYTNERDCSSFTRRDEEIIKKSHCKAVSKSMYAKNIGYKLFDVTEDEVKKRLIEIRGFPRFLLIDNPSPYPSCISQPVEKIQSARIRFYLPNNESQSWEFPDLSTLRDVRAYLMEKANLPPNFKLVKACPRKGFFPQDEDKTLVELSLAPSATLFVIPVQDKTVQAKVKVAVVQQSVASFVLKILLQPFRSFINFFKKHVLRSQEEQISGKSARFPSETSVEKIMNKKTSTSDISGKAFDKDADDRREQQPDVQGF